MYEARTVDAPPRPGGEQVARLDPSRVLADVRHAHRRITVHPRALRAKLGGQLAERQSECGGA